MNSMAAERMALSWINIDDLKRVVGSCKLERVTFDLNL